MVSLCLGNIHESMLLSIESLPLTLISIWCVWVQSLPLSNAVIKYLDTNSLNQEAFVWLADVIMDYILTCGAIMWMTSTLRWLRLHYPGALRGTAFPCKGFLGWSSEAGQEPLGTWLLCTQPELIGGLLTKSALEEKMAEKLGLWGQQQGQMMWYKTSESERPWEFSGVDIG